MRAGWIVSIVVGLALGGAALGQEPSTCPTTSTTIALDLAGPQERVFTFSIRGYVVELRPATVIDYWRNGRYPDPALADTLSKMLPLTDSADLAQHINERLLPIMVADLIESGRATIRNSDGRLLESVELVRTSCTERVFREADNGGFILRWTDYYR